MSALSPTTEADVQAAIAQASAVTDVPVAVLDFIHQHEVNISKEGPGQGTLTNPQGYGGYFGLPASQLAGGDPAAQATTVADLLKSYGLPSWQEAIDEYNTGNPSQGYGSGYLGAGAPPAGTAAATGGSVGVTSQDVLNANPLDLFGIGGAVSGAEKTLLDGLLQLVFLLGGLAFGILALLLLVRAFTGTSVPKAAVGAVALVEGRKELQAVRQRRTVTETRAGEAHASKVALQQQRTKTEAAKATELRTRTKHRRRAKAEQNKEIDRAYVRGATDQLHS